MALKDYLSRAGIKRLLNRVRISGKTVNKYLALNRRNTLDSFEALFDQMVDANVPPEVANQEFSKLAKARKRSTLTTLRNIMVGVRGQARAFAAGRQNGTWVNRGVLDGSTTQTCIDHRGKTWRMPYRDIPNKPPRVPPQHPCRSSLLFVPDGQPIPVEVPFMVEFGDDEKLQEELLGKTKFAAWKRGEFKIRSYADFQRYRRATIEELGL